MSILEDFLTQLKHCNMKKISKKSGVSYNTILNWTSRRIIPTLTNAQKVANAMDMEFLLFDKE